MKNKTFRYYEIKRLDEANIRRSLSGALNRADDKLSIGVQTKNIVLPGNLDQMQCEPKGCYFEGCFLGDFEETAVILLCAKWKNEEWVYDTEVVFPINEILYMTVAYQELEGMSEIQKDFCSSFDAFGQKRANDEHESYYTKSHGAETV